MKTRIGKTLALVLVLAMAAVPALAAEEADVALEKLENFFAAAVVGQVPVQVTNFTDNKNVHDEMEGEETVYYILSDFMIVITISDEFSFEYQLAIAQSDVPDGVNADDVFAMFIQACLGGELTQQEAVELMAWLREYTAQTGVYSLSASRAVGDFTVTLSGSLSDSEEIVSVTRYTGVR